MLDWFAGGLGLPSPRARGEAPAAEEVHQLQKRQDSLGLPNKKAEHTSYLYLRASAYTENYLNLRPQALWPSRLRCLQQRVSPGVHSDFVGGQMSEGTVALAPEKLGRPTSYK